MKLRRRRHLQVCVWRFTPLGLWSVYKRTRCAGVETSPMISLVEAVRTNRDRFWLVCPSLAFFSTTHRSRGFESDWEGRYVANNPVNFRRSCVGLCSCGYSRSSSERLSASSVVIDSQIQVVTPLLKALQVEREIANDKAKLLYID